MKTAELKILPVSELKPAAYNPRKKLKPGDKEYEKIKDSIQEFGFADPLVVNADMTIIGGHQRLTVAIDLGYTEVPCAMVDVDKTREKALNIALNKITGAWDENLLADLLKDIQDSNFDLGFTGFEPPEIETLFNKIHSKDIKEDDFDVEEELAKPVFSRPGDLWCLGKHRVICADSTKEESYAQLMDGQQANLVLTDPPYNVNYGDKSEMLDDYLGGARNNNHIMNDNMSDSDFHEFLLAAYKQMHDNLAKDGSIYVFHAETEGINFRTAFKEAGFRLSSCCIWKKNALVLGRSPYQWIHEPCSIKGTLVSTPNGQVPIETLKDDDKVISFDTYSGTVKGYRDGCKVETNHRHYSGKIYGVRIGDKQTWVTENHEFSVHFNPATSDKWCTYLMVNKDGWWRVGCTRTYDARQFGLKGRIHTEKAVAAWIIATHNNRAEAQMMEQYLSTEYGIPYTYWTEQTGRGVIPTETSRTAENIKWLYEQFDLMDLHKRACRLLQAFNRSFDYPLITEETGNQKFSRRVTAKINACNLIPELMMVPMPYEGYEGMKTFDWESIEAVDVKPYDGEVYSLKVEKYGHYIADGIVTHNCLYGWREDGTHQWYSDRKQTTVWEYDRPKANKDHPTMKPVALLSYPIRNSTMTNGIVLDPFLGSGSTLIACCETDRICRGIELDPKFVDVIVKRYLAWCQENGVISDVYVIRDGQKLTLEEVLKDEDSNH